MNKMLAKRVPVAVLGLFLVVLLTGCGPRHIPLMYEPVLSIQGTPGVKIGVIKFKDSRGGVTRIGAMKNGYGMDVQDIFAKDMEVGTWVANALDDELTKGGYKVARFEDSVPRGSDVSVVISGDVHNVHVTGPMAFHHRGNVSVKVSVMKGGAVVLDKQYNATATKAAITGLEGEFVKCLKKTMQELMKQVVPEVTNAIR